MPKAPAKCGTVAGYNRHKNSKETPCQPCKDAMNKYNRERRAAKKPQVPTGSPAASVEVYSNATVDEHEHAITELQSTLDLLNDAITSDALSGGRNLPQLAKVKKEYLTEITARKAAIQKILEPEEKEGDNDASSTSWNLTLTPNQ